MAGEGDARSDETKHFVYGIRENAIADKGDWLCRENDWAPGQETSSLPDKEDARAAATLQRRLREETWPRKEHRAATGPERRRARPNGVTVSAVAGHEQGWRQTAQLWTETAQTA